MKDISDYSVQSSSLITLVN